LVVALPLATTSRGGKQTKLGETGITRPPGLDHLFPHSCLVSSVFLPSPHDRTTPPPPTSFSFFACRLLRPGPPSRRPPPPNPVTHLSALLKPSRATGAPSEGGSHDSPPRTSMTTGGRPPMEWQIPSTSTRSAPAAADRFLALSSPFQMPMRPLAKARTFAVWCGCAGLYALPAPELAQGSSISWQLPSDFRLPPHTQGSSLQCRPIPFFFDAAAPFPFPLDWSADPQPNRTYGAGGDRGHPPDRTRTLRLMTGQGGGCDFTLRLK